MNDAYANGTISLSDLKSAAAGITGGYEGSSLALLVLIILFPVLSIYNALELIVLIFFTFNKYKGLYFWSLLIASAGVIPYSLGFLLKFANITVGDLRWLSVVLLTIGWWTMVTGQSAVLWSRLHLLLTGESGRRTLCWTKWMVIVDAIILHIPTTVLTFGSNGSVNTATFAKGYSIMEKIQMSGFFLQEVILSAIYIGATLRILRTSIRENTKRLMWQLMAINVIIIIMDMALLGLEAASLYLLETLIKGVIYSIKLKLEFAILGRLVQFVGRPGTSINNNNDERARKATLTVFQYDSDAKLSREMPRSRRPSEFAPGFVSVYAELSRSRTNATHHTHTSHPRNSSTTTGTQRPRTDSVRLPPGMTAEDVDVAMFQHSEDTSLPEIDVGTQDASYNRDLSRGPRKMSRDGDGVV